MADSPESLPRDAAEAERWAASLHHASSGPVSQMPRAPPKGRPPKGYIWCGSVYVHRDSLLPYSHEEHRALMLDLWRRMRLDRYREDVHGFRTRRIETQAKTRIAKGMRPRRKKLQNSTLVPQVVRSEGREVNGDTDKSSTT